MSERKEQQATFLLALLMLLSIIGLSFNQLDRRPSFPTPSKKMAAAIVTLDSPVIFAHDPIALAGLSSEFDDPFPVTFLPLRAWPPEGPLLSYRGSERLFTNAGMELVKENGPWSLWTPRRLDYLPPFGLLEVEVESAQGEITACPRNHSGAFHCGKAGWTHMRSTHLSVQGNREECFWAHPLPGALLRFRFPDVNSNHPEEKTLLLRTALHDSAVGTAFPVQVRIEFGDEEITHIHRDQRGWQEINLPSLSSPEELILEISAEDPGRRHFCFRFERK